MSGKRVSDRVVTDEVFVERYNCARVERTLLAMTKTHDQRMKRIAELEVRQSKSTELHRLRRAVVCYDFLLGVKERFPSQSDRTNLATHVETKIQYYRKSYGGSVLGRRLAQSVDGSKGSSKRRGELQSNIRKWRQTDHGCYQHRNIDYQSCCSELRALLGGDRLCDLDFCNCFPTIAIYMAGLYGVKCDALKEYVTRDREGVLKEIMLLHNVDRKTAKNCPLGILHGGSYWSGMAGNCVRGKNKVPLMKALEMEATALRIAALKSELPLEKSVLQAREYLKTTKRKSDDGEFGSTEVDRSLFSLIMQTREDRLLECMIKYCRKIGVNVESLQFDGLLIRYPSTINIHTLITELEVVVRSQCDIPMKLVEKELYRLPHQPIIDELARVV